MSDAPKIPAAVKSVEMDGAHDQVRIEFELPSSLFGCIMDRKKAGKILQHGFAELEIKAPRGPVRDSSD